MEGEKDLLPLEALPVEVAQHVLGFLEPMDLLHASQVCAAWRQLAADEWVWERVHGLTFGGPLATVPKYRRKQLSPPLHAELELVRQAEYETRSKTWRGACLITAHAAGADAARLNLSWACASGHHRLLARALLERGLGTGQVALPSAAELAKLLFLATNAGQDEVARVLLRHGADPSVREASGLSCVDRAGNLGRLGILELFLERGYIADPSKVLVQLERYRNVNGSLAHQAAKQGHIRFMELLLSVTGAGDGAGRRAALCALLNAVDSRGWAPLHHAVHRGHTEMVELLLRHGADVDQLIVNAQQTPITLAIMQGGDRFIDVVRALIKRHARLDTFESAAASINGSAEIKGAIHVACATGSLEVVSLLLENGVDINARTAKQSRTPLMMALKQASCRLRTIERLVDDFGADLTAEDSRGNNAWYYLCYGRPSADTAALIDWLQARGLAMRDVSPLFSLITQIAHRCPEENADTSRALAAMWRVVGPRLDSGQRHRACLEAARCHRTILAQLFAAPTEDSGGGGGDVVIDPETATRVLARVVTRGFINGYVWRDLFALDNVEFLVRQGGADVNARVSGRDADPSGQSDDEHDVKPICFGVSWFDFKMLHLLQALGADLRARNAMGDTLLAYYMRPTTTACPATTVPSHDPVSDTRLMALFMSWLAHIVKRRGVEGSLRGIYLDLDRPEYHRWPAWAKTLVRDWITNPERDEFDWQASWNLNWPHLVEMLASRTHEPLW